MKQKSSLSQKSKSDTDVKTTIYNLLEKDGMTKKEIAQTIKDEFDMNSAEIRSALREVRSDFLQKLNVLQSGVVRL